MVSFGEARIPREFAAQESACQRYPHDNSDAPFHCALKKVFPGAHAEHIKDDLNGGDVWNLYCLHRLFNFFYGVAEVSVLSLFPKAIKEVKNLRPIVYVGGWTVELDEVEAFEAAVSQACFNETSQNLRRVPLVDVR
jgi:hypothetical protein